MAETVSKLVWKLRVYLAALMFFLLPFGTTAFDVADWIVGEKR